MNGATPSGVKPSPTACSRPERVRVGARREPRVGEQEAGDGAGAHLEQLVALGERQHGDRPRLDLLAVDEDA